MSQKQEGVSALTQNLKASMYNAHKHIQHIVDEAAVWQQQHILGPRSRGYRKQKRCCSLSYRKQKKCLAIESRRNAAHLAI